MARVYTTCPHVCQKFIINKVVARVGGMRNTHPLSNRRLQLPMKLKIPEVAWCSIVLSGFGGCGGCGGDSIVTSG